jgi:hypothetical protein
MRRIGTAILAGVLFATLTMAASWTGWISDEKCGAKGANAAHAGCARGCIKAGIKPVLATEDGKVFKISNPDKVTEHAGEKVELTGTETNGTIVVESVKTVVKPG